MRKQKTGKSGPIITCSTGNDKSKKNKRQCEKALCKYIRELKRVRVELLNCDSSHGKIKKIMTL
jgi:hypothetical protein